MVCRRSFLVLTGFSVCLVLASSSLSAQRVVVRAATIQPAKISAPNSPVAISQPEDENAAAIPAGMPATNNEPTTPEEQLVELLMAAKFERTPQAVLKAWSFREDKPNGSSKKDAKRKSAKIVNAYEAIVVMNFEQPPEFKVNDLLGVMQDNAEVGNAKVLSIEKNSVVAKLLPLKNSQPPAASKDKSADKPTTEPKSEPSESSASNVLKENPSSATNQTSPDEQQPKIDDKPASDPQTDSTEVETGAQTVEESQDTADESNSLNDSPIQDTVEQQDSVPAKDSSKTYPQLNTGDAISVRLQKKPENSKPDTADINKKKVESFRRDVMLGNWVKVKEFIAALPAEDADKVYSHVLVSLAKATPQVPEGVPAEMAAQIKSQMRESGQKAPPSFITPDDILALSEAAPNPIQISLKSGDDEKHKSARPTKGPATGVPPGIKLPPGTSIESLPPNVRAALQKSRSGSSTPPDATANTKKENHIRALAGLIKTAKSSGHDFSKFVGKLRAGTTHFGTEDRLKALTTSELLFQGGLFDYVESFLPALEDENTKTDLPALKIWSKYALRKHQEKKIAMWLEKAWRINQLIMICEDARKSEKDKAITNLIQLTPKVDKELGQAWLNASFTEQPERGMMILSNLGTKSATMATQASSVSSSDRLKLLRLQNKAVEDLLKVSPESANQWSQAMTLLASNWLTEAETSIRHSKQNRRGAGMQIDMYGNYYWVNDDRMNRMRGNSRQPRPIKPGDMLEIMPSTEWQDHVSSSLHTQLRKVAANLHLRINEEDKAFPFIEEIAEHHPDIARNLVHEFLRIWTSNHDPNKSRRDRNPYIYFYGFDQKAEAIPLTRSKQERNLKELSKWVNRIRKMPIEDLDEELLANAFTTCHSSAEVFRLEAFKNVFGELEQLKPETIAAICQKMRANLASNWRDVRNQEQKQTNRREPEVQQEVLRGYDVALKIAEQALSANPNSWRLSLAKACLMYDRNAYSQTVQKSSEFSDKRDLAFSQFQKAAKFYQDKVVELEAKDQSTDVYDYWFYAALGAVDLGKITNKTVPDLRQYPKIRDAIDSLPGNLAEIHMAKVANNMFTRMSPIKPEIKFRYLRGGFEIVGDHPRAWESRNLYDYYKDLVSEIKLDVSVDGNDDVGHSQPFGIYVNLLHTTEIERESGGFAKYVQNQNNMPFAFNYGRPTEDYRDKFSDAVNQALEKHFEILNVSFVGADTMQSIAAPNSGWRLTPYAYILLKSRGPEVDRIAPLKLDLDFLDTSGYVVIPVESSAIVIDSLKENGTPRPIADLQVTQTLDERQAGEGKLILEISATAKGLVPELDNILNMERDDFEIVSVDDQGVLPSRFDKDSDDIQILSDRSWTVEYRAKAESGPIEQFAFSDAKLTETSVKFQRYEDADLVEVEQQVDLEKSYASFSWGFLYWLVPVILFGLIGVTALVVALNRRPAVVERRFTVPDDVNPFTVLTLLQDIQRRNGITNENAIELEKSINRIESLYFGKANGDKQQEDLQELAVRWVRQAK